MIKSSHSTFFAFFLFLSCHTFFHLPYSFIWYFIGTTLLLNCRNYIHIRNSENRCCIIEMVEMNIFVPSLLPVGNNFGCLWFWNRKILLIEFIRKIQVRIFKKKLKFKIATKNSNLFKAKIPTRIPKWSIKGFFLFLPLNWNLMEGNILPFLFPHSYHIWYFMWNFFGIYWRESNKK